MSDTNHRSGDAMRSQNVGLSLIPAMVAAQDMLTTLQIIEYVVEQATGSEACPVDLEKLLVLIKTTISKAKGETYNETV